jgi:hypothetical protein
MKCVALILLGLPVALVGCSRSAPTVPNFGHCSFLGYHVDFEVKDGMPISTIGNNIKDGRVKEIEEIEIRTGDVKMSISSGKVTVNGEPRGTVKSGDRLKLMMSGKLYVNDAERGKE